MFEIKTLNKISPFGLEVFDSNYKCADDFENPDAVIVRSASMHELELAARIADFALCIKNGAVLYSGKPEEVFTDEIIMELFDIPEELYHIYFKR